MIPLGLYIHIPFCKSKCVYCDFYSLPNCEEKMDAYVSALTNHLKEVAPRMKNQTVDTVYFGGGTPSYLGQERLCRLLKTVKKYYTVTSDAEITLEANPDSAGDVKALRKLRRAGFNRISLGVQSTDDALLKRIGRVHTYEQVKQAVAAARKAKFDNLSIDLIYGLPGQTMETWQKTLREAVELAPQHISCYGLKVEEGTPLWREKDTMVAADDDEQAEMYLWTVDDLQQRGYEQYEISNFALPGYESRHNLKYWQMMPYAGFGPGAHSDFGEVRFAYEKDLDGYIAGELRLSEQEEIPPRERCLEYIMLSLRTAQGIEKRHFENAYRLPFTALEEKFTAYEHHGLARRTETGWRLTPEGFLVSNRIIVELQETVGELREKRLAEIRRGEFRVNEQG